MSQEEIVFQEVDEQLEAEQLSRFLRRHGSWVLAGLVLFFAGLASYVAWNDYRLKRDQAASDLFLSASQAVAEKRWEAAQDELKKLVTTYPGHGYVALSHLLLARALVESGRSGDALRELELLATESGEKNPLSDAALMEAAWIAADIDANQARGYLSKIGADSVFRAMALELDGVLTLHAGDKGKALTQFRQALEPRLSPPEGARQRLLRRVERLGGPVPADGKQEG
ncbi:MAG: tetratricopeptide repeat protein [Magnetococcales bacterium]|nr:tetratricopeptide repeat protein [Magnetococcales bacterium]